MPCPFAISAAQVILCICMCYYACTAVAESSVWKAATLASFEVSLLSPWPLSVNPISLAFLYYSSLSISYYLFETPPSVLSVSLLSLFVKKVCYAPLGRFTNNNKFKKHWMIQIRYRAPTYTWHYHQTKHILFYTLGGRQQSEWLPGMAVNYLNSICILLQLFPEVN